MARTRSQVLNPVVSAFSGVTIREKYAGVWYSNNTFIAPGNWISQDSKTMTDDVRPGFFRANRENKLKPVGPMSSQKIEYISIPGTAVGLAAFKKVDKLNGYSFESSGDWGFAYRNDLFGTVVARPNKAVLLQEALSRAQTDAWDTLTFAAELRKTVEGVVTLRSRAMTIADRVISIVNHRRYTKKYKSWALSDIVAQVWLELRYMWRPLVYDMMAMEEAYCRMSEQRVGSLQRSYASDTKSGTTARSFTGSWRGPFTTGGGGAFAPFYTQVETVTITGHAAVGVTVDTRAVTMTDPLVTAWELVPFSFVFDWFITFGSMLSAFSPFASSQLQFATYSETTIRELRTSVIPVNTPKFPVVEGSASPSMTVTTETSYVRSLEQPTPTLSLDINLNVSKIIDLVALWSVLNRKTISRLMR